MTEAPGITDGKPHAPPTQITCMDICYMATRSLVVCLLIYNLISYLITAHCRRLSMAAGIWSWHSISPLPFPCVWCRECTPGPVCEAHVPPSGCLDALGSEDSMLCCVAPWAFLGFLDTGGTMFLLPFKSIVPFLQPLLTCPVLCINSPRESWAVCVPLLKAATPSCRAFTSNSSPHVPVPRLSSH